MHAELHLDKSIAGRFKYAIVLTTLTLLAEVGGGIWTNSLALLSDAAHVFLDLCALGCAGLTDESRFTISLSLSGISLVGEYAHVHL